MDVAETESALAQIVARASGAARVAVDVESNGLHAYRPSLCVTQLAWSTSAGTEIALIDTLATSASPLAALFAGGAVAVLHDLTFDARLLREHGVTLAAVRDTSVAARLLGKPALGLAALLSAELGVTVDKGLQHHDWAARPLTEAQRDYLAADVRHLLALDDALATQVDAVGITAEVADETRYKLASALAEVDAPPGYLRVRGVDKLPPEGQAIVRRAFLAREEIAEEQDVPPFHVASPELLLDLATKRPRAASEVRALRSARGRAARFADAWLSAVELGLRDGALPADDAAGLTPPPLDRAESALRRAREERLRGWRRAEAEARGVHEQAVLPGHCLTEIAKRAPLDHALLAAIPGFGEARLARYAAAIVAIVATTG